MQIKRDMAREIAQSVGVTVDDDLSEFAEREFLTPDGKKVQVMYVSDNGRLDGFYLRTTAR